MEMVDGNRVLRIVEFDAATATWTGRTWLYPLSDGGDAIGDFNMIDDTTALVIERDRAPAPPTRPAPTPRRRRPTASPRPAKLKRIYKIEMSDAECRRAVTKIGYIDLMTIKDPDNVKTQGGGDGFYDMPFITIENVDIVDPTPHHRRQRQQPAVLGRPRPRQGRRQRVRPARGRRLPQGRSREPVVRSR